MIVQLLVIHRHLMETIQMPENMDTVKKLDDFLKDLLKDEKKTTEQNLEKTRYVNGSTSKVVENTRSRNLSST